MMNRRDVIRALPMSLVLLPKTVSAMPHSSLIGLIFVAQSTCPYCRSISPSLFELKLRTGMDVLVASMDGRSLDPFPDFKDGRQHALTQRYRSVPVVLVYNERLGGVTHELLGLSTPRRFVTRLALAMRQSAAL